MKFSGSDLEWIRAQYSKLELLSEKYGWKYLLLLGYADPENSTMLKEFYKFMRGLDGDRPIYIADKYLSEIVEVPGAEGPPNPPYYFLLLLALIPLFALMVGRRMKLRR